MSLEGTREAVTKYLDSEHSDTSMMADDVVFTIMATGEEHRGPEGVSQMLNYFYHGAFDAHKEYRNQLFDDGIAFVEGYFVGEHIGEFAGIQPTNKLVRVPLGVVYELENDEIKRGRVYFEMPALFQQLGVEASQLPGGDPVELAAILYATVHGAVELTLAGHAEAEKGLGDPAKLVRALLGRLRCG